MCRRSRGTTRHRTGAASTACSLHCVRTWHCRRGRFRKDATAEQSECRQLTGGSRSGDQGLPARSARTEKVAAYAAPPARCRRAPIFVRRQSRASADVLVESCFPRPRRRAGLGVVGHGCSEISDYQGSGCNTTCRRHKRRSVRHGARSFSPSQGLPLSQEPRSTERTCSLAFGKLKARPHGTQLRPRCWNTPVKPQEAGSCGGRARRP